MKGFSVFPNSGFQIGVNAVKAGFMMNVRAVMDAETGWLLASSRPHQVSFSFHVSVTELAQFTGGRNWPGNSALFPFAI